MRRDVAVDCFCFCFFRVLLLSFSTPAAHTGGFVLAPGMVSLVIIFAHVLHYRSLVVCCVSSDHTI